MIYRIINSALGARGVGSVLVEAGATLDAELSAEDAELFATLEGIEITSSPDSEDAPSLSKMTVDELKAFAEANDIDLGDATKKADILSAIELALEDN